MAPNPALETLQKIGVGIPARWLTILGVAVPIALVLGAGALALWKRRKALKAAPPPAATSGASGAQPQTIAPNQLRKAWRKFLSALPTTYRRSILNFEHFVVLGDASSGKSRLIDSYTDWRRQAKQFLGSQAFDPDLQVYLGSGAIVTEVPPRVLGDHSARCRAALQRLWRPLYRKRTPTVVVVVDAMRLGESTPEAIDDLAERIRGKINVLSAIRKRPLDVRVVATHLDGIEGWEPFSGFCHEQGIPLRIPLAIGEAAPATATQIEQWLEHSRGHLARALVRTRSSEFRHMIGFLRNSVAVPKPIAAFVDTLFAAEALSERPRCAGLYLGTLRTTEPSPLRNAADVGPGPDPRMPHLVACTLAASVALTYLASAFSEQRGLSREASVALASYKPSMVGSEAELRRRESILAFATPRGVLQTRPDFYASARVRARAAMSERVRSDLLIPNLRTVAQRGSLSEKELSLPWRRALYYLALIHGHRSDGMKILNPERLEVWSKMTELGPDILRDYLTVTDVAWHDPVAFEFADSGMNVRDTVSFWTRFLKKLDVALAEPVISRTALAALQAEAADVVQSLDRLEHDDRTRAILANLDESTSLGVATAEPVQLEMVYRPMFEEPLANLAASNVFAQRDQTRAVFRALRTANVDVPKVSLARELASEIRMRTETPLDPGATVIALNVGGEEHKFDGKRWAELIRDTQQSELINEFLRPRAGDGSIFFAPGGEREIRPVSLNATNNGSAIFVGSATIEGQFTRDGYEKIVRSPVVQLFEALEKAKIRPEQRSALEDVVRTQVRRYGAEYKIQLVRFFRSFGIATPSQEALRVALAQMAESQSPFTHFVTTIDRQVDVPVDTPMLEPMKGELDEFAVWHRLVDASSGSPEVAKYRAILAQMLADLGPPAEGPAAAPEKASPSETLETALTSGGRLALVDLRGEKGSYAGLIRKWLASVQLPASQQGPFLAPIDQLDKLGRTDIEQVIQRVWDRDIVADLSRITQKFPFDQAATNEVTANELDPLINPQSGRVFDVFRRYIEPISEVPDGGAFRQRAALRGKISVPPNLYALVNGVGVLASHLYDATGKPRPLSLRIATVPFEHGQNARTALTLVYLNIGEASILNFNQKPGVTTVRFDWTREQVSQVGVQLTNLDTQENLYPDPIATPSSPWSILRLLNAAQSAATKQPPGGIVYSWDVRHRRDGADKTSARFVVIGNLADIFSLGQLLRPKSAIARTN